MNPILKIIIVLMFFSTLSCSEKTYYSGKILSDKIDINNIKNKEELISTFGKPSLKDDIQNKYYYYSEKKIITNFFKQEIDKRTMLVFTLNNKEDVISRIKYNLDDYQDINIFNKTTRNNIVEKGFIEKIFGGIGKTSLPNTQ